MNFKDYTREGKIVVLAVHNYAWGAVLGQTIPNWIIQYSLEAEELVLLNLLLSFCVFMSAMIASNQIDDGNSLVAKVNNFLRISSPIVACETARSFGVNIDSSIGQAVSTFSLFATIVWYKLWAGTTYDLEQIEKVVRNAPGPPCSSTQIQEIAVRMYLDQFKPKEEKKNR